MKPPLFISVLLIWTSSIGQVALENVQEEKLIQRIELIKIKTDSFLLTPFKTNVRSKFKLDFVSCGYFRGEFHSTYHFLNSDKPDPMDLNDLTHAYTFFDKEINLQTDITIQYRDYDGVKMRFQGTVDSLTFEALNRIYNKGFINKIKAKNTQLKLKNPYVQIQVDEADKTFEIILKDKFLPHNYFIV
jgi:hypothetical protein